MDLDFSVVIFIITLLLGYLLSRKSKSNNSYTLEELGIKHEKPLPLVGNMMPLFLGKVGGIQFFEDLYRKFRSEKIIGFYGINKAIALIIADPDLYKKISVKDFDYFVNRDRNEKNEISDKLFGKSLLQLRDNKWKSMRTMLSPIYTGSKLKTMFSLMVESTEEFVNTFATKARSNSARINSIDINTHDTFSRVTADGIATTALGFKSDCITNEKSEMFQLAQDISKDFGNVGKYMLMFFFPTLYQFLGIQLFRKSTHDFFNLNVLSEIKRRSDGKISRPDVIQLLVQAKEGQLKLEINEEDDDNLLKHHQSKANSEKLSDEDLVAQAFIFFVGGFETTTVILQALSFELASNPEVQETLFDEVNEVKKNLNGKTISFEELNKMKYLDMVINEALRKWPSFRAVSRFCARDYELKDDETGKTWKIRKGTDVIYPFAAMCRDEKYFKDPEKFDPLRFSEENKKNIPSGLLIAFGSGPRMCIGSRYALIELKLVLFYLISEFKIEKNEKTPTNLTPSKATTGYVEDVFVDLIIRKK